MGTFGPKEPHPSVNETNTHTDEELISPEFRTEVKRLKKAIRFALASAGDEDFNMAQFWSAMQETVLEVVEAYSGREHAEEYERKLREFNDWQNTRPVTNPEIRQKQKNQRYN